VAGEVRDSPGWDGSFGPYIVSVAGKRFVDASNPARADQTRAALDGTVGFSGLDRVDSDELIRRIEDLAYCRRLLADENLSSASWLVAFEQIPDWAAWNSGVWPRAKPVLTGPGYVYLFAQVDAGNPIPEGDPPLRQRFEGRRTVEIQLSRTRACWRPDTKAFKVVNR
jgi:hypothetical protein